MHKNVYLYVFDTMADWEIGYICAELNSARYFAKGKPIAKVITLSIDQAPVTTMGGINILPDLSVLEFEVENASMIILPGGDTWMDTIHDPMLEKIEARGASEARGARHYLSTYLERFTCTLSATSPIAEFVCFNTAALLGR